MGKKGYFVDYCNLLAILSNKVTWYNLMKFIFLKDYLGEELVRGVNLEMGSQLGSSGSSDHNWELELRLPDKEQ